MRNNVEESFTKKSVQEILAENILEPFLNFLEALQQQTPVMFCCHRAFDSMKFLSDLASGSAAFTSGSAEKRLKNLIPLVADFRWFFQDKFSLNDMSWHDLAAVLLKKRPELIWRIPSEQVRRSMP